MDWFGAIQRCFQWSERVEQLPIDQRLLTHLGTSSSAASTVSNGSVGGPSGSSGTVYNGGGGNGDGPGARGGTLDEVGSMLSSMDE